MKPIIIVPPDTLSAADLQMLRDNDLCVVVAKDPARVKFVDPIPALTSRTQIEHAAIQLSRKLLAGEHPDPGQSWSQETRSKFALLYVGILINGTPLEPGPTQAEKEETHYNYERFEEIRRIAREDAKAERAAVKAKKVKAK